MQHNVVQHSVISWRQQWYDTILEQHRPHRVAWSASALALIALFKFVVTLTHVRLWVCRTICKCQIVLTIAKKNIGRFAQKKLSLFLQIVHLQIKNRKNDLQIDLQLLRFSNQGVDLQVHAQISTFANLFSNRSQANTWNIKYALVQIVLQTPSPYHWKNMSKSCQMTMNFLSTATLLM